MTSPNRSVVVRLSLDPSSYVAGASRAAAATTALDREVSKVGGTAGTSMERAASSTTAAEGAIGRLNKSAGALGFTLGGLAGVGGAVAAALSVKWAGDYQSALTKLATTAGESQKNLAMVGHGMLDMAGQVGIGADELAKGMYTVESSGIHGANALVVLKAAAQGAKQENADLGKVTDAVTTALHDYNLPASDAAKVTSQLVTAVSHGKTTFDELTGAMHSVTPLAAALHVPLADIAGTLSAMTASGESADQAAQNMADALRHLQSPTSTMTAELGQLGINSAELGPMLGQKGLAGTIQYISSAIVDHLDPATKQVLLPALNQSKNAAADLQIMLGQMPPSLQKLSRGLMDGSVSLKDYRTDVRDLGGAAEVMGTNFMGLFQSSQGFSNILKSGSPAAQEYTAALQKAMGTSAGLTVALQVTGEHAAATNNAIKDIARSAGDAKGNIKGWDEVQGNFNQQLSQAEAHLKSMAIEAGQHLLPVLTGAFGYINRDVLPGISGLASGVSSVAHWFGELPAPIKDTAEALGILALANKVGIFSALESGAGRLVSTLGSVASGAKGAFTSMEGLRSAGSGLMNLFGGPWVLATAGAALGVMAIKNAIDQHDAAVKKATQDVQKWNEAIALGGSGQSAIHAEQHLESLRQKISELSDTLDRGHTSLAALHVGGASAEIEGTRNQISDLNTELSKGEAAWKRQLAAMTPVEEATARMQIAEHDLQMTRKDNPPNSQAVTNAEIRLQQAREILNGETDRANNAEKTRIQQLQDSADALLGLVDANRRAQQASLSLTQQVSDYNKQIADGTLKGDALTSATLGIVDSAEQAAKAAGDAAAQQAKQNGATDTGSASHAAFMKTLQDFDATLTGPAKKAMDDYIAQLGGQQSQAKLTAGAINSLGITVTDLPNDHMITINAPTEDQKKRLQELGYVTVTLPNGKIVVTADTNPAIGEIQDLLNYARQQAINYRATLPDLNGSASGNGRMGTPATGGWISGPGSGTSDTAGVFRLSNREFVVNAAAAQANGALLEAINGGARVHTSGVPVPGYATGGWVGVPPGGAYMGTASIPVSVTDAGYMAGIHKFAANFSPPYNPSAGVEQWRGLVSQVLQMLGVSMSAANGVLNMIAKESGGNPRAINLTDSNARAGHPSQGLLQTIPTTFARWAGPYAGRGITDPLANIYAGVNYALHTYGFGMLAAGGRKNAFGGYMGYETGTDYVPSTGPAVLHKGEAVLTTKEAEAYRAGIRSREVNGGGGSGSGTASGGSRTMQGMVFNAPVTITDTDRMNAKANRHLAMAAARFGS